MTLEERVTDLEKRIDILGASEARMYELINEQLEGHATVMLGNMTQMRQWLEDLQEHFKSHSLDKKNPKSEYDTVTLEE